MVETDASAEADAENPVYVASNGASYTGSYPTYAGLSFGAVGAGIPVPPQLPTWLPPPPYVTRMFHRAPAHSKQPTDPSPHLLCCCLLCCVLRLYQ